jgi:hypothetical protein
MKLFTHSQKPGSSLASIPGWVWLKLAADHPHVQVLGMAGTGAQMGSIFAVTIALDDSLSQRSYV